MSDNLLALYVLTWPGVAWLWILLGLALTWLGPGNELPGRALALVGLAFVCHGWPGPCWPVPVSRPPCYI